MPTPIVVGDVSVALRASPIEPSWVVGAPPVARNALLSRSRDGLSCTVVWDCSPGAFVWRYDSDETIHVLEGRAVLDDGVAPPREVGPGAVVLFPAGAVVRWQVVEHVRKLAFFHKSLPAPLGHVLRAVRKAVTLVRRLASARPTTVRVAGMSLAD